MEFCSYRVKIFLSTLYISEKKLLFRINYLHLQVGWGHSATFATISGIQATAISSVFAIFLVRFVNQST